MNLNIPKAVGAALLVAWIAGCGGGSGAATTAAASATPQPGPPPVQAPTTTTSGVYDGAVTDTGQPMTGILQADGSYYLVYFDNAAGSKPMAAIVGNGVLNNGSFTSTDAGELNLVFDPALQVIGQGSLSASYTANQSFNGTLTYSTARPALAFTGSYNGAYATQPALSSIAGTYTGSIATRGLTEDAILLTIGADGKLSGQLSCGCNVLTTLSPNANGNGYVAALVFDGGTHPFSNKSMAGNVYVDVIKKHLYIYGKLSGSNDAAIFVGTKV